MNHTFLAIDLGAGSGRLMAAITDFTKITLEEVHRFDNPGSDLPGGSFWNPVGLYQDILAGLRLAGERYGSSIVSIGIDTWGCDYALLDANGELLGLPHQYRDPRSGGMAEAMHTLMPERDIYERTGLRSLFYNSSLHLLAARRAQSQALAHADKLLFMPDLLGFWLSGRAAVERTIASTSQLLDPRTGQWAWEVIDALGLPRRIFGEVVPPGTVLGPLREEICRLTGVASIPVVATACHDTASAVAGIPMSGANNLWLSSGTWSIMGVESPEPITSDQAFALGFCNELGAANTVRFLKNISGQWLVQECKRQWALDGEDLSYAELDQLAEAAPAFTAFIDPDDPSFASPGDMPEKIRAFCARTGQTVPTDKGAIFRMTTESLALKYRVVFDRIRTMSGRKFTRLRAGGGGIRNTMLNQATANALGIEVVAGPVEATSCGNVIIQMVAGGHLPDLAAGRDLIRKSFELRLFLPGDETEWTTAYERFRVVIGDV